MKKDTIRLILFTDCKLSCAYCCNKKKAYFSQFVPMQRSEVDFSKYEAVCLTGGEPFLKPDLVFYYLDLISSDTRVYLYTTGLLITEEHLHKLSGYPNLKCVNVGLHYKNQIKSIHPDLEWELPVRFMLEDTTAQEFIQASEGRLKESNTKQWVRDVCDLPNEDWVILKE